MNYLPIEAVTTRESAKCLGARIPLNALLVGEGLIPP